MKIRWKPLLISLFIPLGAGGLSALLSGGGMQNPSVLRKPPLSPPEWLFPVAWSVLYLLMGFAAYLIWSDRASHPARQRALFAYGLQLIVNFFWSPIFFSAKAYLFAFLWLLLLWALVLVTALRFAAIRPAAGRLILPYLAWVTLAGYLNFGIYLLN